MCFSSGLTWQCSWRRFHIFRTLMVHRIDDFMLVKRVPFTRVHSEISCSCKPQWLWNRDKRTVEIMEIKIINSLAPRKFKHKHYYHNRVVHMILFNLLRTSDAIWQHRSGSILVQVMTWCHQAPSHYLSQCWLIISEVQWYWPEGNFTRHISVINH